MASITVAFTGTWITDPTTGQSVQGFKVDRKEQDALAGEVRKYAGGRTRIITTSGDTRTSPMTFRTMPAADVEVLRSWRGRVLLLRDPQGWRRWGTFLSVDVSPTQKMQSIYDVALTWVDVTYDEAIP